MHLPGGSGTYPRRSFQRLHTSPTPSPLPPARALASVQLQISRCLSFAGRVSLRCSFPYSTSPTKGPESCGLLRRGWRRGLGPGLCPPSRLFLGSSVKGGQSPPCHGRDVKVKNRKAFCKLYSDVNVRDGDDKMLVMMTAAASHTPLLIPRPNTVFQLLLRASHLY